VTNWHLDKRGVAEVEAGPEERVAALDLSRVVSVTPLVGGRLRLRAKELVGTIEAGGVRLVIEPPAMSRSVLLGMMSSTGARLRLTQLRITADPDPDLLAVLTRALCEEARQLMRRGLRRTYAWEHAQLSEVRGEVLIDSWRGPEDPEQALRPPCRYRTRVLDLPEHRLLRWVLHLLARRRALSKQLRSHCAAIEQRLGSVALVAQTPAMAARCQRTGLCAAYAPVLDLCELLLQGLGGERVGERTGRGFLIDSDRLFERWLLQHVRQSLPDGWRADKPSFCLGQPLHGQRPIHRELDIRIRRGMETNLILDAKHKAYRADELPGRDDLHQLLTYMVARGCRRGALVGLCDADSGPGARWWRVAPIGEVAVVRLEGAGELERMERGVEDFLAGEVARREPQMDAAV